GTILVCPKCGPKGKLTKTAQKSYTIIRKIPHTEKEKLEVRKIPHTEKEKLEVTEMKKLRSLTDEEREELEDSYGDMLEQMDVD
ncbi:MAG: hypothetical protein ACTSPT_05950, partial [Candidatus Heimdallarchaeota archaeon]